MGTKAARPNEVVVIARRRDTIYQDERPLMGAMEAAQTLGVEQTNLRTLSGLPEPYQVLRMGSVWLADDIIKFRDKRKLRIKRAD